MLQGCWQQYYTIVPQHKLDYGVFAQLLGATSIKLSKSKYMGDNVIKVK